MAAEKKIDKIRRICEEKNLNIYEVFREAKTPISTIPNWTKNQPGAFDTYDNIMEAIGRLEALRVKEEVTQP